FVSAHRGCWPKIAIKQEDLRSIRRRIKAGLRAMAKLDRKRWKTLGEISLDLGFDGPAAAGGVVCCAKCWEETGRLAPVRGLICIPGKVRDVPRDKLRDITLYDSQRFQALWRELSDEKGIQLLEGFFAGKRLRPVPELKEFLNLQGY